MSAFDSTPWRVARADALETEAEALVSAIDRLDSVLGLLDNIERPYFNTVRNILDNAVIQRRESAARLRIAA